MHKETLLEQAYDFLEGDKKWIQKAINPKHKGWCTPMSKPTCTGRRRALALLFKRKHGFHRSRQRKSGSSSQ